MKGKGKTEKASKGRNKGRKKRGGGGASWKMGLCVLNRVSRSIDGLIHG